jgi:hypothetical protein
MASIATRIGPTEKAGAVNQEAISKADLRLTRSWSRPHRANKTRLSGHSLKPDGRGLAEAQRFAQFRSGKPWRRGSGRRPLSL